MPEVSITHEAPEVRPQPGIALCLSGGGYRAMLFHLGALWRMNDAGYLPKLDRISSVSGGSIIAGTLGLNWLTLGFDANGVATQFGDSVVGPIRSLASTTIDVPSVLTGLAFPGPIARRVEAAFRRHLYKDATLQDLPAEQQGPRFVINATNLQTGALWRFSRPYVRDYLLGEIAAPRFSLATAVAASSAFPPVLSPFILHCEPHWFTPGTGQEPFTAKRYRKRVWLSDGGVYDNLGLETAWKRYETILVSDGGAAFKRRARGAHDWLRGTIRVLHVEDNQVRSLRKRQLIEAFHQGIRKGTYWGLNTDIDDYGLSDALPCPIDRVRQVAAVRTRLSRLPDDMQERLTNWGYAVCDAALRTWMDRSLPRGSFPYPARGV